VAASGGAASLSSALGHLITAKAGWALLSAALGLAVLLRR